MKIAILSPFYPYRGGIAQFSDRLYQELVKEHETKVFSYSKLYPSFLFPGKTQYVPNPEPNPDLPSVQVLSSTNLLSYSKTAKAINEYNPDVLLVAYWMPYLAVALSRVCAKLNKKIKIIGLVHNAIPHEKSVINRPLTSLFFNRCHAFICMSQHVKNDLMELGIKAPILALEHPIYDHYPSKIDRSLACQKLDIDKNKKTILFFGLIRAYKGLDLLIEAMNHLDDSYQLVIAGECYGSFTSYKELIELSKNKDNIKVWNQYIPDEEVTDFFSATDALILPYRSATQSGVVAIAYQMGIPIVATNVGSLGDTVRDSKIGIVATDTTPESIAQAITNFFASNELDSFRKNLEKEKIRLSWHSFVEAVIAFTSKL